MKTIWKYEIPVVEDYELQAPEGARFLPYLERVEDEMGMSALWVWAEVDSQGPMAPHRLRIHGAGEAIPPAGQYIGTARDGVSVWHLYLLVRGS